MKRSLVNLITLIFLGFLLIGAIGVIQNIILDLQKTFTYKEPKVNILAYTA